MSQSPQDLLQQLRIERADRDLPAPRRRWPWLVAALIVLVALVAGALGWRAARAPQVQVATVQAPASAAGSGSVLQATGYVTARREATVSAQITGRLTEVHVEEGEHVQAGQLLARLDDSQAKAQLALARANEAAARAALGQYQANATLARITLRRARTLVDKGLASRQSLDQAVASAASAEAALADAREQIAVAVAQRQVAEVNYDYTFVRAPFAGVITDKAAQVGEIVSPLSAGGGFTRTGVATIVDMNSLEVDVDVNESYIHRVHAGQPAEAVLDAYPDWRIPARVIAIVPTADKAKATVKVRVALLQKSPRILPDMGVRVNFLERAAVPSTAPEGVLVSAAALVDSAAGKAVWRVRDTRVERVPVRVLASFGDLRQVGGALRAGESVVIRPGANLRAGMTVRVARAAQE
ncbi:efflux RND transporter periplasmic adaptor subunit [Metallibacterium scheffleri]|jgi:RND family efflux transporter MFP subunit|uniref:efflux RND transporter periplasmic adaptor subunit n=1 Tax=Metallibacterium scheffleri TaxID=993689 RepID=UPI0023F44205|nr:efflux RND transporter periplasmic adaptor subunit [Metallibacterium scheffleri]